MRALRILSLLVAFFALSPLAQAAQVRSLTKLEITCADVFQRIFGAIEDTKRTMPSEPITKIETARFKMRSTKAREISKFILGELDKSLTNRGLGKNNIDVLTQAMNAADVRTRDNDFDVLDNSVRTLTATHSMVLMLPKSFQRTELEQLARVQGTLQIFFDLKISIWAHRHRNDLDANELIRYASFENYVRTLTGLSADYLFLQSLPLGRIADLRKLIMQHPTLSIQARHDLLLIFNASENNSTLRGFLEELVHKQYRSLVEFKEKFQFE